MSLRSVCSLFHSSRAWLLLWSALLILLLWLPVTSAFGVSTCALKSPRNVIGSQRPRFGASSRTAVVVEATGSVEDSMFFPVLIIAVPYFGYQLLGRVMSYLLDTPSIAELRSEMHKTNKGLEDLESKLEKFNTELQGMNKTKK